jgi:glutathione S-transferase
LGTPVLWHIAISHYSEKARWALDYKAVEHDRRAPLPGAHMLVALALTRGRSKTFPLLQLDGRTIADSTAIIAALEERYPEPPLYPSNLDARRRALELEDYFDEELAPHMRLLAFHEALKDPEAVRGIAEPLMPRPLRRVAGPFASRFASFRYGVEDDEAAERARSKVLEGLDRLEQELGGHEHLVGGVFTVADLTAAALFYPLVTPPEGPRLPPMPEAYERFRSPLKDHPGYRWVEETYRRYRT